MNHDQDQQFQSEKIARVEASTAGDRPGWHLTFEAGFGIWCTGEHCQQEPAAGETARLYGKGFGYCVRGIVIEGRVYRYLTPEQEEERRLIRLLEIERERQEQLDRERSDRDARRAALPEPFRLRLDGFEAARPNWRRDHEAYELFCCDEACRLAERFATVDELVAFSKLNHAEQQEAAPELRFSEHSGNTFGASLKFAAGYLQRPDLVPQYHGAICPLVGCEECGCFAARPEGGNP